jgi:hypothetical protein
MWLPDGRAARINGDELRAVPDNFAKVTDGTSANPCAARAECRLHSF